MRLIIREKVFSFNDKFTITDDMGNDRYFVEGEFFSWGKKLHVYNARQNEVAYIEQTVLSFLPRYRVFVGDVQIAEVVREFSFFRPKYTVVGPGWEVDGEFWAHDYTVYRHNIPVVRIAKEWMTWGDCYTLDIKDPADEIQALSLVLAIDCAIEQDNH